MPLLSTVIIASMFSLFLLFFYLQSEDEREMCARTVYCTNIDKKVWNFTSTVESIKFFYTLLNLIISVGPKDILGLSCSLAWQNHPICIVFQS